MSDIHLTKKPKVINENTWYVEVSEGIRINIGKYDPKGNSIINDSFLIHWGKLRRSLKRKDRLSYKTIDGNKYIRNP